MPGHRRRGRGATPRAGGAGHTRAPRRRLPGLAGLAPKGTKRGTVGEGVAAISKGDVRGTLVAVDVRGGPDTKVGAVAARLEKVAALIDKVP